jgi:glutamate synthase domain-containing protein 3
MNGKMTKPAEKKSGNSSVPANGTVLIDAEGMSYKELNRSIRNLLDLHDNNCTGGDNNSADGLREITIRNVSGQRYIGDGIKKAVSIKILGTPGNDLAAFMDGPEIEVFGNCQDGTANTMNSGKLIIHGDCGDILGYSMRGGEVYVKGNVGWRSGIHMKSYMEKYPVIVVGGKAGNFLGEYMAGGVIIVLGFGSNAVNAGYSEKFYNSRKNSTAGGFLGTGMHGGTIFLKGDIEEDKLGKEVRKTGITADDSVLLEKYLKNFCSYLNFDYGTVAGKNFDDFIKLAPFSHRPYGRLYAY